MTAINSDMNIQGAGLGPASKLMPLASEPETKEKSFKDLLQGLVEQVDTLQQSADVSIKGLATGQTTDIHDVTVKMEEAGIALELMMQVRNKLLEAYQQVIRMEP